MLRKELTVLLQDIMSCIVERNKKDIIINWVDALSYYNIPQFPFLEQKAKEGICFDNAYIVMSWTTETTRTILSGEYPIEGKLFLREFFPVENTKLLNNLRYRGYGFGYCGMLKFSKFFDEAVVTRVNVFESKYAGSMQKQ